VLSVLIYVKEGELGGDRLYQQRGARGRWQPKIANSTGRARAWLKNSNPDTESAAGGPDKLARFPYKLSGKKAVGAPFLFVIRSTGHARVARLPMLGRSHDIVLNGRRAWVWRGALYSNG
jgi:hypothetical protein